MDNIFESIDGELQYDFLKKKAIEYIDKIGGNKWNDYEEHDPGITILEELCFAIIDLDYRISFSVEDILANNPQGNNDRIPFYEAADILPTNPVTVNDFQKVVLDIDGVRNCKIIPINEDDYIGGLYNVLVQVEPFDEKYQKKVISTVEDKLNSCRNLCEDFNSIKLFDQINVLVDVEIVVNEKFSENDGNYDGIAGLILVTIQDFFVPTVHFSTLSESLQKKTTDEIYNGPKLEHGFILDEDLSKSQLRTEFNILDILDRLLQIKYIDCVHSFSLKYCDTNEEVHNFITIENNQVLRLIFNRSNVVIVNRNSGSKVNLNNTNVLMISKRLYNASNQKSYKNEEEIGIYEGRYRNLSDYKSIQNDFPLIYNVGFEGISDDSSTKEKMNQVRQLKEYLMFFDQIFKNYLVNFDNIKNNFSIKSNNLCNTNLSLPEDIPDIDSLLKKPRTNSKNNTHNDMFSLQCKYMNFKWESNKSDFHALCSDYISTILNFLGVNSRETIVKHLLSRFSERTQTGQKENSTKINEKILSNYVDLSYNRLKAPSNSKKDKEWDDIVVSSFEKKFSILFQINNLKKRLLHYSLKERLSVWSGLSQRDDNLLILDDLDKSSNFIFNGKYKNILYIVLLFGGNKKNYKIVQKQNNETAYFQIKLFFDKVNERYLLLEHKNHDIRSIEYANKIIANTITNIKKINSELEGFHMVEHILLRTSNRVITNDDYSFKISFIFPDWPARFQQMTFRERVNEWITENIPAHIDVDILWLNVWQMEQFEYSYKYWYEIKNNKNYEKEELNKASDHLLNLLKSFNGNV